MNKCYNDCTSNDVVHFMVDWDDVKNKPNVDDRLSSLEQQVDNIVTNSGGIDIDLDSEFSRLDNLISTTDNTLNDFKNEVNSWQTNETQHINNVESGLNDLSSTVEDYRTQHVSDINYLTENVNLNRAFIESGLNAAGDNLNSVVEGLRTVIQSNKEKTSLNRNSILELEERVISNESYVGNTLQEHSSNHSRLRTEFDTAYSYLTNEINQINIKMPPNFSRDINLLNERIDNITGGDDKVDWDDIQNKPNLDREIYLLEQRLNGFEDRQTAHINDFDSRFDHLENTEINVLTELGRTWDKATINENNIAQLSSNVDIIKDTQTTYITTFDNRLKYLEENQEQDIEDIQYLSTEINNIKNSKVDWDDIQNIPDINNIETRLSEVEGKQTSYINNFQTQINNINNTVNNNHTYLLNTIDGINTRIDGINVGKFTYNEIYTDGDYSSKSITNIGCGHADNNIALTSTVGYIKSNKYVNEELTYSTRIDVNDTSMNLLCFDYTDSTCRSAVRLTPETIKFTGNFIDISTDYGRVMYNSHDGGRRYKELNDIVIGDWSKNIVTFNSQNDEYVEWTLSKDTFGIAFVKNGTYTLKGANGDDVVLTKMEILFKHYGENYHTYVGTFLML